MTKEQLIEKWTKKIKSKEDVEKNKLELYNDLMIYAVEHSSSCMELVKVVRLDEEVK